ncbi:MAG: acyl-CoA thioesterase [Candidatus Lokiarchaeota archaeon]|nr:acyl-CoA thioesterase [Candidatus Lokiarchaeota archaeon]
MEEKKISESAVEIAQLMMPANANPVGNVHGGTIMKIIDEAAGIAALRHSHKNCVTASVDKIDFISPVFIGNLVIAKASINYVSKTSMEIGVRVESENIKSGEKKHVASAYLTFVALDARNRPTEIPNIILETDEQKRRYDEAKRRREYRIKNRVRQEH